MKIQLIIVFATCGVLLSSTVQADNQTDAKAAYKSGKSFYKAGKYQEAIRALSKAYRLKPHPALLRYIGDAYFKQNKARKAIRLYKRYLKEAPQAADREKVEGKVRQLELVIGASEEEETPRPAPAPAAAPAPAPAPSPPPKVDLAPTGEDREVPVALKRRRLRSTRTRSVRRDTGTSTLTVMKWVALGLGIGGLATGITFNRLAAGKADDLVSEVQKKNPDMNKPTVQFNKEHFDLQQAYKRDQAISIASFVIGGVSAATSVVLFIVDRPKKKRTPVRRRRVEMAPMLGEGICGVMGEVTF